MKNLKKYVICGSVIGFGLAVAATVALGGGQNKTARNIRQAPAKANVALTMPPVSVSPIGYSTRMSPEAQAEDEAAYAPSSGLYKQAKELYQTGDLAGAEQACLNALNSPPIIHGQQFPVPFVPHLLGQVYLKEGQYEKAIYWLQGARPHTVGGSLNLDLALAYLRLGDYDSARQCYSDKAILQCCDEWSSKDLPGTDSPQALEASILLARGLDVFYEHSYDDALPDLQSAHRLAPENALIAYYCAKILTDKGRYADATRLYGRAIATSHGIIHEDAVRHYAGGDKAIRDEPARPSSEPLF